ncbi:putative nucleotidyltransferase [Limihaloglobus sulfuriphilus]|uniref:Putative nucleotidyltransferase n=1 Tax=Limihaloglobus sulfuriphilus TaxID=1851148 RepID=A0A1Q2MH01_9BACT|nr:nucleotidyltransferase domain-containing protein [Limihaloglobus sulfuriphilus]AQQ71542.1 putative nucleotidyltransferase [Limihaloglobus sulfuriphilus]
MSTVSNNNVISRLFGKTRQAVLALFFTHPDESYYFRQVVKITGMGNGAIQRELKQLSDVGILNKKTMGRQVFYNANTECPIFEELSGMILKTSGVVDVIRKALAFKAEKINIAFIYGSLASGKVSSQSDIDLMVAGSVTFSEVVDLLMDVQAELAREINPSVYSLEEFIRKISEKHHFLTTVLKSPKIFIIGDDSELRKLVK